MKKPEILSPVQDKISLVAAIDAGADAVYFGVKGLNMRAGAKNFSLSDIKSVVDICHDSGVKAYLALNTIIYEGELDRVVKVLKSAKKAKIDAVICWDMAVLSEAMRLRIPVHLSTQASSANSSSAEFFRKQGVSRIIFARECSLSQLKKIMKKTSVEVETFVHGAMCVSVSGRCFLSQEVFAKSANRGECLQPCRRKYLIKDIEEMHEFELGEDYVMSPKDLCTLPFIEKLIDAEIDSFKIEGRNRSPEYVKTVTSAYRTAVDYYVENKSKKGFGKGFSKLKKKLIKDVESVYNRGFSSGFFLGKPMNEWCKKYGSKAKKKKIHVGKVVHFYKKIGVAEVKLEARGIEIGDKLMFQGPTTGVVTIEVKSIEMDHGKVKSGKKGELVAVKTDKVVRKNDKVFVVK